jgi:cyclase
LSLHPTSEHFNIQEINNGVFAAIAVDGRGAVANAGIIDMGDYTMVFDTFNTQQAAADLNRMAKILTGKEVRFVINSHWHGDHIRGNQSFSSSTIISSHNTFNLMKSLHPGRIERQKAMLPRLSGDIDSIKSKLESESNGATIKQLALQLSFLREIGLSLPDLHLVLPSITFQSSLSLYGTSREVKVISMGAAHTSCDSVLLLPQEKIAFTADIISIDNHPMFSDGNPNNWLKVLEELKQMDIELIIPGHGPVGSIKTVETISQYIKEIINGVEQFIADGYSIDKINQIDMPNFSRDWQAESNYHQNIRFLFENISKPILN